MELFSIMRIYIHLLIKQHTFILNQRISQIFLLLLRIIDFVIYEKYNVNLVFVQLLFDLFI